LANDNPNLPKQWSEIIKPEKFTDSNPATVKLSGSYLTVDPETGIKTVTSTAAEVFAGLEALSGRDKLIVYNEGSNNVYWGKGTVTPTNGFPLLPGDSIVFSLDSNQNIPIYFVAESDTVVRVGEMA
jgi:hypothetical protein